MKQAIFVELKKNLTQYLTAKKMETIQPLNNSRKE